MKQLLIITCIAMQGPPDLPIPIPDPPPERITEDWDESRWIEYLARRSKSAEVNVPTACGQLQELSYHSECYEVCVDKDWREAVVVAMECAISTEKSPGVYLLCPEGRREHYLECMMFIQYQRSFGVPLRVKTMAIPTMKGE